MISALILACIAVIILLAAVLILSVNLIDCKSTIRMLTENLRNKEDVFCRVQNLVYKKFNYRLPMSDKYLSIEEIMLEKQVKEGK